MTTSSTTGVTNPVCLASSRPGPEKWFSPAKITHPKTSGVFPRNRLFRTLDECRESPVIWVPAPAGSGKTTLVASYLADRELPSIWYRVDEGDGDIATFFYYMGLAAKKAAPHSPVPLPLLTPEYMMGIPAFTRRFFENLYSRLKPPFVIVFDNYHHVPLQPAFHEVIRDALDAISDGINAIIISRETPPPHFARLQANGKISLLQHEEICFSHEESKELMRLKGFRDMTETTVDRIYEKTRGWAAGLVLMTDRLAVDNLSPQMLSGTTPQEIFDYFATEIFDKSDRKKQEFLLETSFLPWVSVRMARKLTGSDQSEILLADLHRNHFFTERDTEPEPVYRYHPLFREFLMSKARSALSWNRIVQIHKTAAGLFMESGHSDEAAAFFLDAGDWNGFISFILDNATTLTAQGRIKTLGEWLSAIPAEMVDKSPWLLYWLGHTAFVVAPAEGRAYLERAFKLFIEQGSDSGALQAWAGIAETFIYDFDDFKPLDRWIDWLDERICRYESFPSPEIEAAVASGMVGALIWRQPDHPALRQWIERALSSSRESGNRSVRLLALRRALLHYVWVGDKQSSLEVLGEIGKIVDSHSAPPVGLIAAKMVKAHYYAWLGDEGERALGLVEEGLAMADKTGIHVVDSFLAVHGAFAALNKGDEGGVTRFTRILETTLQPGRRYVVFYHNIVSMRLLLVGRYSDAHVHAMKMMSLSEESGHPFTEAWARLLISQAAYEIGDHEGAEKELSAAEEFFHQAGSPFFVFTSCLIRAYFSFKQGKKVRGMEILDQALQLGRCNGYTYTPMLFRPSVWSLLCARALGAGIEIEYVRELIRRRRLAPPLPAAEYEDWPWPVKIYALGRFDILIDGKRLEFSGKAPRRIISLLKTLVAFGAEGASEERLIDILWPDSDGDAAHVSFSVSLHRLRQLLGSEKALQLRDARLRLDPGICWVDTHAFEELLARAEQVEPDEGERFTEKALLLYAGPFLGETGEPCAISTRERLRNMYLRAIRRQGSLLEDAAQVDRAADLYEKGLEADPLAEELYRRLMKCHHAAGRRSEAIATYERCRKKLRSTLGVDPSRETEALYRVLDK